MQCSKNLANMYINLQMYNTISIKFYIFMDKWTGLCKKKQESKGKVKKEI